MGLRNKNLGRESSRGQGDLMAQTDPNEKDLHDNTGARFEAAIEEMFQDPPQEDEPEPETDS